MNGIDKIADKIMDESRREIDEIIKKAHQEAENIRQYYDAEAEALTREMIDRGKAQAKERIRRLAGVADLEARKMMLGAKQEMIERAFQKALDDLLNLPEEDCIGLLSRLVADFAEAGSGEVLFSQEDRTRFGSKVIDVAADTLASRGIKPNITLSEETHPFAGGVQIKHGNVEINCSFEAIIRFIRGGITKDVADVLFAKPEM